MLRATVTTLALALAFTQAVPAQQPKPPARAEAEKPAPPSPPKPDTRQLINIKLELTLTDQTGTGPASKRTVSMIVADGRNGSIRNSGRLNLDGKGTFNAILNVDAEPWILPDNRIRLQLSLEYIPKPDAENAASGEGRAHLTERLALILEPGKPMVISQASDPTADRKIAVELLATILK